MAAINLPNLAPSLIAPNLSGVLVNRPIALLHRFFMRLAANRVISITPLSREVGHQTNLVPSPKVGPSPKHAILAGANFPREGGIWSI